MQAEFIRGFSLLIGYFAVCAASALIMRRLISIPGELFRKTLHMILLGSILVLTYGFETWWISALAVVAFIAIVFPLLAIAERISGYSELLIERRKGEIKKSLLVVFGMFLLVITVSWGLIGEKYLVLAPVFAWGMGDAAAAIIGKRFGKRHLYGTLLDGNKTIEGLLAMFVVSFISVMVVLILSGPKLRFGYVPVAAVTAGVTAVVELYTKDGMDTLTCPVAAAFIMIALVHL